MVRGPKFLFIFSALAIGLVGLFSAFDLVPRNITADSIFELINRYKVSSIDQLLPLLPKELRANFSLVYQSRNRKQHASFETPRIILFSNDGSFQMTVAGSAEVDGGSGIEMMTQTLDGKYNPSTITFVDGKASYDTRPTTCVGCHGAEIRPIWDGYSRWGGVYGSDHQILRVTEPGTPTDDVRYLASAREVKELDLFLKRNGGEGRYAHLIGLRGARYGDLANLNMHLTETIIEGTNRKLLTNFFAKTGIERHLPAILKICGTGNRNIFYRPPTGTPVDVESAYEILKPKREAQELDRRNSLQARMSEANPGFYGPYKARTALDSTHPELAYLEAIGVSLGIEPEFWEPGIQNSIYQQGPRSKPYSDFHNALVEEIIRRDRRFARYVSKSNGTAPMFYQISAAGFDYLSRPEFTLSKEPMPFRQVKNPHALGFFRRLYNSCADVLGNLSL